MSVGANIRWTPAEAWLIAEVARRSLVASLDHAPPIAPGDHAAFRLAVDAGAEAITLELALDAEHAIVTLAPSEPAGHRWRDGWMLELERVGTDERWTLSTMSPSCELADARRGPFRAHLRLQRRAFQRELAGETIPIVVTEVACHRFTRQSTLAHEGTEATELGPWMVPTRPERAPWWELDLGKPQYLAWLRVDLAAPAVPCRVIVRAYGFVMPSGDAPPGGVLFEGESTQLATFQGRLAVTAGGVVARYLRVELAGDEPASLAITAVEVLASELFADSLLATMRRAFAVFRDQPLVLARAGERYEPALTYGQVWARALALGRGLARFERGADRTFVAVMLRNRWEWIVAELAALVRGHVVVPLSPEDADDRLAAIFARAAPACVIVERDHAERARRLAGVPVIVCDEAGPEGFDAVCEQGLAAEVPEPAPRAPEDLYSVLFTSGSTGVPKGAMRSYAGLFAMIRDHVVGHSPRHLSFQPLSHMSERTYLPSLLVHGGTIAFSRGGAHLLEELRALEPTTIGSVPRLYEVLHAGYQRRLRALLAEAPARPRGELEAIALAEARGAFGGQLFALSVGSAPVSAEVLAFLRRCFADIWVSEGYGSTEVGTIASDGRLPEGVLVKLVPLAGAPEEPGQPERGEIYVLAPHLITGYLGDAEATAAAFDADGYFATGDLGERDAEGRVRVIGRVRNTVKLAQGEFVSAERIETALAPASIVDRLLVHAAPGAVGVAALVVPAAEALARALGVTGATPGELVAHPEAAAVVLGALRARARAAGLAPYETPRGVLLVPGPFTAEAGELTASGKLARGTLVATYGARLAALAAGEVRAIEAAPDELAGDLHARVVAIAARVLGHAVAADDVLAGTGVDSLASAEILAALSDELRRDVPLAWWFESRTFGDLAERLARFAGGDGARATRELAAADRAWSLPALRPRAEVSAPRRVLVTGATGFLGAHLVEALRARSIDVVALVRAPDDEAARSRLAAALAEREVPAGGVAAVAGDLADPGLAGRLAALEVDAIVHAGATVSWLASYPALRGPNVVGTRSLVELAAARGLALHHVSTISTAPADGDEASRLAFEVVAGTTPYALSKWIAEDHVARARDAGLAAAIYRPAMIAGHTTRGIANPDDYLCRYLAGCVELGLYIDRDDAILDMTPVDFVAAAIVALVLAQPGGGGTFHLANVPRSLSFAAFGRALRAAGHRVEPASYAEFRAALHAARPGRLHALAAFFPETFSLGMGPWPASRTEALLAELGVAPPKIDDAIVARYAAWLDRRGHLPRAC